MRKRLRIKGLAALLLGLMALFSSLSKPGVHSLRGHEIVGLIGCGMCFGVAFVALLMSFETRQE